MPGNGRGKKKDERLLPPKEKKKASQAEVRAENKATGQQGKALAAAVRSSYGYSTICGWRSKAEIAEEFHARNDLEWNNMQAWHNQRVYQKHHDDHALRWLACNHTFDQGRAVAKGRAYSLIKNQLEK